jgi:hypothetical protein
MHLQYYRRVSPEMPLRFSRVIGIGLQKLGITHFPPQRLDDLLADLAFEVSCERNLVPDALLGATRGRRSGMARATTPANPAKPPG